MGQWFSWVKSNEKEILTLLNDLAKKSVEAAEAVQILLTDPTNKDQVRTVTEIETSADGIIREIFTELNNTFITPLDRGDMQRVASKIDDIIDFMDGIASRFNSYKITVISKGDTVSIESISGKVIERDQQPKSELFSCTHCGHVTPYEVIHNTHMKIHYL